MGTCTRAGDILGTQRGRGGAQGVEVGAFLRGFQCPRLCPNDRASYGGLALLIGSAATASKPTSRSRWRHLLGTSPCPLAGPSPLPPGATKMGLILWLFLWIFWGLQRTFPGDIPWVPPPRPRGVHILGTGGVGDVPGVPRTEATLMEPFFTLKPSLHVLGSTRRVSKPINATSALT